MAITKEHVAAVNKAREELAIERYNKMMNAGWHGTTDFTVDSKGNVVDERDEWGMTPDDWEKSFMEFPIRKRILDTTSEERKQFPMARGLLDYFPDALAEVSRISYLGNLKHNPGQEMHHARGKSTDHADCIMRHLAGRGGFDGDTRESASLAWRALALLQEELEAEYNLGLPRGAKA